MSSLLALGWIVVPPLESASLLPSETPGDLTELSLADLANLKVTSVSKAPQERSRTAAAIFVITQEDIRRSGATTIPEALRLAPGVDVARIDSNQWAVGVRGFGDQFSKSVLVLIDGRNVYTPLFAGVDWEIQDLVLEDVDRMEVIRGPGGTIWGTDAVNGVINIITKAAKDTKGLLVSGIGGTLDQLVGQARYGGGNGGNFDYRVYGKGFSRGPAFHPDGNNYDDWRAGRVGFRGDWALKGGATFTLQGDAYKGTYGENLSVGSFSPPGAIILSENIRESGGNLLAAWRRPFKNSGSLLIQAYYSRNDITAPHFKESRDSFDLDAIHHIALPGRQELAWGLGVRSTPDRFSQTIPTLDFEPNRQVIGVYSAFIQDGIEMTSEKLWLTLGVKLEHNTYTGLEVMPSARLLWRASPRHTLWAAVTRAVRSPSRIEEDFKLTLFLQPSPLAYLELDGNKNFKPERLIGYEAGYRALLGSSLYLDVAGFHNDYDDLQSFGSTSASLTVDATPAPPHLTFHLPYVNEIGGNTDGFEVALDWKPVRRWNVKGAYSYLSFDLAQDPGTSDVVQTLAEDEGSSPKHEAILRSQIDLPGRLEFDQVIRHVGGLSAQKVSSYTTADLRLAWRFAQGLEFSVVGQNLLQPHHAEFGHDPGPNVEMPRSVYARISWTR